jgi:hypothetical protein
MSLIVSPPDPTCACTMSENFYVNLSSLGSLGFEKIFGQIIRSSILDLFRENLPTVCLRSIVFSQQNLGYLPGILIIPGCCKKMV